MATDSLDSNCAQIDGQLEGQKAGGDTTQQLWCIRHAWNQGPFEEREIDLKCTLLP